MEIKPLAGLTGTLRILLKISIAVTVFAILADFYSYFSYFLAFLSYANPPLGHNPIESILLSELITGVARLVKFIIFIILGVTFLRWIYRINRNLHTLSGEQLTFTPGWSVGWYFIPIANLFKPYQVMKEIWRVSQRNESTTYALLSWWWFLWIVFLFPVGPASDLAKMIGYSISNLTLTITYIVFDGIDVILNIVALKLVTGIGLAYSRNIVEQSSAADGNSTGDP